MNELSKFYSDIKDILSRARHKTYSAINTCMVEAYWLIGQRIVEEGQNGNAKAGYGEYLITGLSKSLSCELGKSFLYANLWNFRQFYLTFLKKEMLYTVCRKLS